MSRTAYSGDSARKCVAKISNSVLPHQLPLGYSEKSRMYGTTVISPDGHKDKARKNGESHRLAGCEEHAHPLRSWHSIRRKTGAR